MIGQDSYYSRPEVSNSDLSALKNYFMPKDYVMDVTAAYRFGNLIDAMITEAHRCDHYNLRVDGEQFSYTEWAHAGEMRKAFLKDPFAQQIMKVCSGQAVKHGIVKLDYEGIFFELFMRCKYDLWADVLRYGGDIKSTTATTQKQFEEACRHFDYDRQRAVYMTLSGAQKDVLIGISKVNLKVFKLFIDRKSEFYLSGMQKFRELAFKYWTLFGDVTM
jgi:hypothetical protein